MAIAILGFGLILFLGAHSVPMAAPAWRANMRERLGEIPWQGLYSVPSLLGLILIGWGYDLAREAPVALYHPPVWTRHLSLLIMVPVFPLLFAAYLPGRIQSAVKHPMLLAVAIWALAHLVANGTLADLLLFGAFFVWSVADRLSFARRMAVPVLGAPPNKANDWIALGAGLALYVAFLLGLHQWLIGVAPLGVR
jgi:uncharacterized membrane protein